MREVVITGVSLITPVGSSFDQCARGWREGIGSFEKITEYNPEDSKIRFAGVAPKPDAKKLPDRKVQKILRKKDINALLSCLGCLQDAGLTSNAYSSERSGMFVGTGSIQINDLASFFPLIEKTVDSEKDEFNTIEFGEKLMREVSPLALLQTLMNNGLCYATMAMDFRGVNGNIVDFQTSGLRALGEGFRAIAEDRADIIVAGGISAPVEPMHYADGVELGYLADTSLYDHLPQDFVKPWDKNRCGAIMSEGVVFFCLEEKSQALQRGAKILAQVKDFATASDGHMNMMSGGAAYGLESCLRTIMQRNDDFRDLAAIIGHANGSIGADDQEAKVYNKIFKGEIPCYSPKGSFGDMCEASGPLATAVAIDMLQTKKLYPMFNFETGDEHSQNLLVPTAEQSISASQILITTRNLVGSSAALLIEAV